MDIFNQNNPALEKFFDLFEKFAKNFQHLSVTSPNRTSPGFMDRNPPENTAPEVIPADPASPGRFAEDDWPA
jgi:hypothetical protein